MGKKLFFGIVLGCLAGEAFAQSLGITGTAGNYSVNGTDTYGLKAIVVKIANIVSDDGLNKIVGFGGSLGGAVMAYQKQYVAGAMTAAVSMIVGYLPQFVDGAYGAMI